MAFADVLQQLESPETGVAADGALTEEAETAAAARAAGSTTGSSERAVSKQTDLSRWLK